MSTYDDSLLAARFAALAPRPLPGDWDDVLDRAGAVRPRRDRLAPSLWRGGGRRKLVVALAVAVLVAAVAAAAYGTVRVVFLDKGFIGLPPLGATPSTPESGELVVRWEGGAAPLSPQQERSDTVRTWVYADGRIIWDRRPFHAKGGIPEGANEFTSGYLEQRLAPEGVELVRAAVAELFDRSRTLVVTIPAEEELWTGIRNVRFALFVPNDYADNSGIVAVPDGDRHARLHVRGIATKNDRAGGQLVGEFVEGTLATPEQLSALRRVHALLTDPASVLPSSAWAVRKIGAYVPSHYAVCIDTSPPKDASELLSLLPARAADVLRDKSRTRRDGERYGSLKPDGPMGVLGRSAADCYKLATEEAREVAGTLSGLDPMPGWGTHYLAYRVAEGINWWEETAISFEPYFPDGRIPDSRPAG